MIGVDLIGQIRCAFFEQRRAIKEISRELRVSRATVRKVVRSDRTAFKYAREVQPAPKLGEWIEPLTKILEEEATLPKRERRSTQRLFEEKINHFSGLTGIWQIFEIIQKNRRLSKHFKVRRQIRHRRSPPPRISGLRQIQYFSRLSRTSSPDYPGSDSKLTCWLA